MLQLNHDEIITMIPYAMICETRDSHKWDTKRRKEKWDNEFTESEKKEAYKIFAISRRWYLVSGVPDSLVLSLNAIRLWYKISNFCASI